MWSAVSEINPESKRKAVNNINKDGIIIADKYEIATEFNTYFANIDVTLAFQIIETPQNLTNIRL